MIIFLKKVVLLTFIIALCGCEPIKNTQNKGDSELTEYKKIAITHSLGTSVISYAPKKVVALDMNEVDALDQLQVPVAGMPKDFVPHFLADYKDNQSIRDVGAIVQPNIERIYALKPDIILMTSLQANYYQELSELAPTLYFDVNYLDSGVGHIEKIKEHMLVLGEIFNKQVLAKEKVDKLDSKFKRAKKQIETRSEKAMIVLHNNGALRYFGVQSRYGFIYNALGVKPASLSAEAGSHGQPISHEFMYKYDPDIIYVIDRTAVMENKIAIKQIDLDNPLLQQTNAWKNNRIQFVDSEAWYITGASYTSLMIIIDDVLAGYL
ncbi:MAG: iron complex transport system substrate-binding protein [Colwellia sp.]|jgi:iron complex transport system substrate-binding protein